MIESGNCHTKLKYFMPQVQQEKLKSSNFSKDQIARRE